MGAFICVGGIGWARGSVLPRDRLGSHNVMAIRSRGLGMVQVMLAEGYCWLRECDYLALRHVP